MKQLIVDGKRIYQSQSNRIISMLFPYDQPEVSNPEPEKTLFLYENGAPQKKHVELRLPKRKITFKEISKALNMNPIRLFNSEGAEYFQDDLQFVKNKSVLYASNGQDFDPASCFGEYEMMQKLGEGGFGKVFLAKHKQTGDLFAIKIIKTELISSAADIDSIFTQAEVLKTLKHENIVKVHNCLTLKNMQVAIIMEYLGGGQLQTVVQKEKTLQQERAKGFFKQIVKGMVYCHQHNLIHRDLKMQNLLLLNSEQDKIKIIDFGIAGVMNFLTWDDMDTGSLGYMAPECFIHSKNYKVDGRIDVWASGVILYGLLTGEMPFKGTTSIDIIQAIKLGKFRIPQNLEKRVSKECLDILQQCLIVDSKARPTMEQLTEHPWIAPKLITEESLLKKKQEKLEIIEEQPIERVQKQQSTKPVHKYHVEGKARPRPPSKGFK